MVFVFKISGKTRLGNDQSEEADQVEAARVGDFFVLENGPDTEQIPQLLDKGWSIAGFDHDMEQNMGNLDSGRRNRTAGHN
jgi:hypothetical protein